VLIPVGLGLTAILTATRLIRDFRSQAGELGQHGSGGAH
jgi:hypothetical protein